ncbi:hypothetical protein CYMTET_5036 [Cymbomonas tetramitiformis]|uniref:Sucrose phosphatase-like domain-containing protein n=1 Tax=Cymbomonas tetramitiformis TaxID=36881 RepID=A0AAE0GZY8_9CHLO|nr:hypothetical protein CYMTET_5036 [Cymbomonas tetramitiformis]
MLTRRDKQWRSTSGLVAESISYATKCWARIRKERSSVIYLRYIRVCFVFYALFRSLETGNQILPKILRFTGRATLKYKMLKFTTALASTFVVAGAGAAIILSKRLRRQAKQYGRKILPAVKRGSAPDFVLCLDLDETLCGRSVEAYKSLVAERNFIMIQPQIFVPAEGQSVYWFESGSNEPTEDLQWEEIIKQEWNVEIVRKVFKDFADRHQHMVHPMPRGASTGEKYRESRVIDTRENAEYAVEQLQEMLSHTSVNAQVFCCGGAHIINHMYWVGAVPRNAGKGQALSYILNTLGTDASKAMVAGDSGNDLTMFRVSGVKGTIVRNAQSELVDYYSDKVAHKEAKTLLFSSQCRADAIIEGMEYFGF